MARASDGESAEGGKGGEGIFGRHFIGGRGGRGFFWCVSGGGGMFTVELGNARFGEDTKGSAVRRAGEIWRILRQSSK